MARLLTVESERLEATTIHHTSLIAKGVDNRRSLKWPRSKKNTELDTATFVTRTNDPMAISTPNIFYASQPADTIIGWGKLCCEHLSFCSWDGDGSLVVAKHLTSHSTGHRISISWPQKKLLCFKERDQSHFYASRLPTPVTTTTPSQWLHSRQKAKVLWTVAESTTTVERWWRVLSMSFVCNILIHTRKIYLILLSYTTSVDIIGRTVQPGVW